MKNEELRKISLSYSRRISYTLTIVYINKYVIRLSARINVVSGYFNDSLRRKLFSIASNYVSKEEEECEPRAITYLLSVECCFSAYPFTLTIPPALSIVRPSRVAYW